MTNDEKIQSAEQLIAEATALLQEVKAGGNNEEDIIAKYEEDYCKGKKYYIKDDINDDSISWVVAPILYTFENTLNPYRFYLTKELAEQAKKLKDFNDKLLAFKYCYDLDYKPDWDDDTLNKHYVYYDIYSNKYVVGFACSMLEPLVYFSTKEIAQKCANWLNSLSE